LRRGTKVRASRSKSTGTKVRTKVRRKVRIRMRAKMRIDMEWVLSIYLVEINK
jgi:hypothetical protein